MSIITTTGRPAEPENRVTLRNIVDWQEIRARHDEYAVDPTHMLIHLMKCVGPLSSLIEHRHHGEPDPEFEDKRVADLVISAIWLAASLGYDVPKLVANRVWDIGIRPKREELPAEEREDDDGED